MIKWKEVSKEEFEQYLRDYPRKLVKDYCGISEPPLVSYNDFTLGDFPESIVAKFHDEKMGYCPDRPIKYLIREMEK